MKTKRGGRKMRRATKKNSLVCELLRPDNSPSSSTCLLPQGLLANAIVSANEMATGVSKDPAIRTGCRFRGALPCRHHLVDRHPKTEYLLRFLPRYCRHCALNHFRPSRFQNPSPRWPSKLMTRGKLNGKRLHSSKTQIRHALQ